MRVHALGPDAAVEGLGEGVVRRLPRPGEIERDALGVSPQVEIAGDELAAPAFGSDPWSTRIVFG